MAAAAAAGGASTGVSSPQPLTKHCQFLVYQNSAFSAALTTNSLRPSKSNYLSLFSLSSASAFLLLSFIFRENWFIDNLKFIEVSHEAAYLFVKGIQALVALVFFGTLSAIVRVFLLWKANSVGGVPVFSPSKGTKDQTHLTNHQLGLLGRKLKADEEPLKKPPKAKPHLVSSYSDVLVPLHPSATTPSRSSQNGIDRLENSAGKVRSFGTPTKSPGSPSLYLVPATSLYMPSAQTSPGLDQLVSTPWSNKRASSVKEIATEEKLEQFLADLDDKITESAVKLATPPLTISSFSRASPNTFTSSANTSGATRSTPLRPVRMSPVTQKFSTPPKMSEGELPPPMSVKESIEAFENMGIYPHIEQWRDRLRQWFSLVLLKPLLEKIQTSHTQVMQSAAKLGISITINSVGSNLPSPGKTTMSSIDRTKDWQPAFSVEEDGLLHQLRASLVQAVGASTSRLPFSNVQQSSQQNAMIPIIQECVDAITEHLRLQALMKGEWVKGLLPQSSVRAEYMVQRIQELAEGTCLKNYDYLGNGEVYDKANKKWSLELPTDSHLLIYLFCAYLEHPKWTLHIDPTSYTGVQYSKNPLFLGALPPKERFPEKYVAVISSVPSVLHPGSCILAVGRQCPLDFALYWDKKAQFSLQGRSALWDSILLTCHRIRLDYGGIVRGMHLGSSALRILPVFEPETET